MPAGERVVIDDRLLVEELLSGLPAAGPGTTLWTTSSWYYRACRAAVAGAGGHLSGPFEQVDGELQERAIISLLDLRADISLPDPRVVVPVMADLARRRPRLNLLNLEAAAAARVLSATVWLSEPAAAGLLPEVLDGEGVPWMAVPIE